MTNMKIIKMKFIFEFIVVLLMFQSIAYCSPENVPYLQAAERVASRKELNDIISKIQFSMQSMSIRGHQMILHYISGNPEGMIFLNIRSYHARSTEYEVYSTMDNCRHIKEVNFVHNGVKIYPSAYFLGEGVAAFYSPLCNCIFHSFDHELTFTEMKAPVSTFEIFASEYSPFHLAVIVKSLKRTELYVSEDGGETYNFCFETVRKHYMKHTWVKSKKPTLLTANKVAGTDLENFDIVLLTNGKDKTTLLLNCTVCEKHEHLYVAVCLTKQDYQIFFSFDGSQFVKAVFPHYIRPMNFGTPTVIGSTLFIIITNITRSRHLFSAPILDQKDSLYFVRLLDQVSRYERDCSSFNAHPVLQGIVLITQVIDQAKHGRTLFSFNFGFSWTPVRAPDIITNYGLTKCLEPDCYIVLDDCDKFNSHDHPEYAPWLVLKTGAIVRAGVMLKKSLYISKDAGFSWSLAMSGKIFFKVLDHGGIIVACPEISREMLISIDEGRRWGSVSFNSKTVFILGIIEISEAHKLEVIVVAYSAGFWLMMHMDFTNALARVCTPIDYEEWRLFTVSGSCLQGKRVIFNIRKQDRFCASHLNKTMETSSITCHCTVNDFGCNFGHVMKSERCVQDPDHVPESHSDEHSCEIGQLYVPDEMKIASHKMDNCKMFELEYLGFMEFFAMNEICFKHEIQEIMYLLNDDKLEFYFISPISSSQIAKFHVNGTITDLVVDVHSRAIFSVISNEVYSYHYGIEESEEIKFLWRKLHLRSKVVLIDLDHVGRNIYYMDTDKYLGIFSPKTGYYRTIWKKSPISSFRVFAESGLLMVKSQNNTLYVCQMVGENNCVSVQNGVNAYTYDDHNNRALYTISDNDLCSAKINESLIVLPGALNIHVFAHNDKILKINCVKDQIVILDKNGMTVYNSTGTNLNRISLQSPNVKTMSAMVHDKIAKAACDISHCSGICVNQQKATSCMCQEGWEFRDNVCACIKGECTNKCQIREFHCKSSECIHHTYVCDGVGDCEDSSDELECKNVCSDFEFQCSVGICIDKEKVCDGTIDCTNGQDEKSCNTTNACKSWMFNCQDGNCISMDKACDGKMDCLNNMDETQCHDKCLPGQYKCKDLMCISKLRICDGTKDCASGEDEEDSMCGSCEDSCPENKCLRKVDYCDGYYDCLDGRDEHLCSLHRARVGIFIGAVGAMIFLLVRQIDQKYHIRLRFKLWASNIRLDKLGVTFLSNKDADEDEMTLLKEDF